MAKFIGQSMKRVDAPDKATGKALYAGDWPGIAREVRNDLAFALYRKFPVLTVLRDFMLAHGALGAEVSGSGSSLFAIAQDQGGCRKLGEALRAEFGDTALRIFDTCTVLS